MSPRIRLSTGSCRIARPWCGDLSAPVAVANYRYRLWPEQLGLPIADLPSGEEATDRSPTQPVVPFANPFSDPVPRVVLQVAERLRGHAVSEVVAPSLQHAVDREQQVGKRSMLLSAGERSDLVHRRGQSLLRWVGVDRSLAGPASSRSPLDAVSEEVETLVDVADPRLLLRQAQTHRSEHRAGLVPERFGVLAGAFDHHHEVVRVADQAIGRTTSFAMLRARPFWPELLPLAGEVLVQHGQGD